MYKIVNFLWKVAMVRARSKGDPRRNAAAHPACAVYARAPALEFTKEREHAIRSGMSARELIERQLAPLRESFQREVYDFDGVDGY